MGSRPGARFVCLPAFSFGEFPKKLIIYQAHNSTESRLYYYSVTIYIRIVLLLPTQINAQIDQRSKVLQNYLRQPPFYLRLQKQWMDSLCFVTSWRLFAIAFSTFVLILIFFVNCSFQNIHCFPFSSLWTEPSFGSNLWSHFVLLRRPHWTALFAIVLNRLQYVHICIHTHHVGTGSIWAFLFYLRRGRLA